jgi:hypothetical protein
LLAEIRALGLDRPIDAEADGDLADDDCAFDSSSLAGFGLAIETLADRLR